MIACPFLVTVVARQNRERLLQTPNRFCDKLFVDLI